jgi:hypothetical protein
MLSVCGHNGAKHEVHCDQPTTGFVRYDHARTPTHVVPSNPTIVHFEFRHWMADAVELNPYGVPSGFPNDREAFPKRPAEFPLTAMTARCMFLGYLNVVLHVRGEWHMRCTAYKP